VGRIRNRRIEFTTDEVDAALTLLAANGGKSKRTADQLAEQGLEVSAEALRSWRNRSFPKRYEAIRQELGRDICEKIAGQAFERVLEADELLAKLLKETEDKLGKIPPAHLAKAVQSIAQAKSANIQDAQLLRDRPTEIKEVRSVEECIAVLERYGLLKKGEDPIDVEVAEESDV
jgi:hypothetical protein